MQKTLIIGIAALLVGGGIGYLTGHASHAGAAQAMRGEFTSGGFAGGARGTFIRGAGGAANVLSGTVAAKDSQSITVDTRDGSSHVILLSPSTAVTKSVAGSLADVSVGATILVTGTTTSGGLEASMINLR